jgi:L-2-hydroxyglutarate oxidase
MSPNRIGIVGAGLIGLATARALHHRDPSLRVVVFEREAGPVRHQSGRNSGVVHSGIYYQPGSLKATFCRQGKRLLEDFCREQGIPLRGSGKLILATHDDQLPELVRLHQQGQANGVNCRLLSKNEVRRIQPRVRASAAIDVEESGLVDFGQVGARLSSLLGEINVELRFGQRVDRLVADGDGIWLQTKAGRDRFDYVVNCAGVYADRLAASTDPALPAQIVPFRGEYYRLRPAMAEGLAQQPLYPVPDPRFPFLGVHFTPTLEGQVVVGPNAVLALARDGYGWGVIHPGELARMLAYPGFWRMALRHWRMGLHEWARSCSKRRFAASAAELVPGVQPADLLVSPPGVRAQAVGRDGRLVDDFLLVQGPRRLHMLNAPSPAATGSLRIGQHLAELVRANLGD